MGSRGIVNLQQLVNSQESLKYLLETKMPIAVSYQISKLIPQVAEEVKIHEEKRQALVKEYGAETETKGSYQVTPENMAKFIEELIKLGEIETNIEFTPIKVSDLGDIQIEPKHLITWLFE